MDKTDDKLLDSCKEKLQEILDAPHSAKPNLMQTDGKLIINYLNYCSRERQSQSGREQARAVIAKMVCGSKEEVRDFFNKNLPEIIVSTKQLKK